MNTYPLTQTRLAESWARRLVERRHQLQLSQQQVAELAGITQAGVSLVESGRAVPQVPTILALAKALGTTPGELFPWPPMSDLVQEDAA